MFVSALFSPPLLIIYSHVKTKAADYRTHTHTQLTSRSSSVTLAVESQPLLTICPIAQTRTTDSNTVQYLSISDSRFVHARGNFVIFLVP